MKREWLYHTILRTASLVAPGDRRADWLDGWRSDLWYVPRRGATRFCLGAFRDALWLRRNNPNPRPGIGIHVESPLSCLGLLAILAAICLAIMVHVPCAGLESPGGIGDFARGMAGMLILSFGLLAATRAAMGRSGREPHPMTWRARLRLGIFLALKIALIQPILLCGLLVCSALAPVGAMGLWAFWALPCHWVLKDQRRRCPVCLRLAHRPGSHRQRIADLPRMVWGRVDVLARAWTAALFGNFVQLRGRTRSGSAWAIPGAVCFRKPRGCGNHDARTAQCLQALPWRARRR